MFADAILAARIDRAEARECAAIAATLPKSLILPVGEGLAVYARARSPLNKVIGVALGEALDEEALAVVEARLGELGEPTRVELSTLARPEAAERLSARGYRIVGFEHVLGRALTAAGEAEPDPRIEVTLVGEADLATFVDAAVRGFAAPDASSPDAEQLPLDVLDEVCRGAARAPEMRRYLARVGGEPAGAGSLHLGGGVALLAGAATLPPFRRRGVQAALLAHRLADARRAGCELAAVTTSPGTQSMANSLRQGFSLLYARVVLVR
jgi:GNAT superfamily N-acetyltransferase